MGSGLSLCEGLGSSLMGLVLRGMWSGVCILGYQSYVLRGVCTRKVWSRIYVKGVWFRVFIKVLWSESLFFTGFGRECVKGLYIFREFGFGSLLLEGLWGSVFI